VAHRKQAKRAKSRISQSFLAAAGARLSGRKTVGKTQSPRHKKFLAGRETRASQLFFLLSHCKNPKEPAMTNLHSSPDTDHAVSQLSQSLAQAAESQRLLAQEMTVFAKDESLRFANLRLDRNGATLDKLQNCHGIPGLIGVQQEWLRDFLQDYASPCA
jgi:hypothetical protein